MRPVHPKVPSEAEATIGPVMLAGHQQAIAGQTTCPFDLNAWRILHPPKRPANGFISRLFLTGVRKTTVQTMVEVTYVPRNHPLITVIESY